MENNNEYPIFCFELDGLGRYGTILVAARNAKLAFNHLNEKYGKNYQIKFDKEAINLKSNITTLNDDGKILFKHFIEI